MGNACSAEATQPAAATNDSAPVVNPAKETTDMVTPQASPARDSPRSSGDDGSGASDSDDDDRRRPLPAGAQMKKLAPSGSSDSAGKGMGASKAFVGAIVPPSNNVELNKAAPNQGLTLEWAYGYRAFDSKSNLVINSRNELVYPVAGLVVVFDPAAGTQRHFLGHSDDVRCLAIHPTERDWVASGQNATVDARGRSAAPHVCVWNTTDFSQSFRLQLPVGARAVRCVTFSPCGQFVLAVANDDDHTLSLWDWRAQKQITSHAGDKNAILQAKFNPTVAAPAYEIFTVGTKHAYVWRWEKGSAEIKGKRVALGGQFSQQTWNSVTFTATGSAVLGGFDGTLSLVKAGTGAVSKQYPAVAGASLPAAGASSAAASKDTAAKVFTLDSYNGGIVAGLSNKTLVVYDTKLSPVKTLNFQFKVTSVFVRERDLVVGTQGGQIYCIPGGLDSGVEGGSVEGRFDPLTQGHMDGELWALTLSKDGTRAYTAGEDNSLCEWDLASHKLLARGVLSAKRGPAPKVKKASTTSLFPQNQCARAIALSPSGEFLAVGTNDGALSVFRAKGLDLVARLDLNPHGQRKILDAEGQWIQTVVFSPNGNMCAVGTHGSAIVLLDFSSPEAVARGEIKVRSVLHSHHSFLTHMDWSTDGTMLRSNDGAYELLFHSIPSEGEGEQAKQITSASSMKDVSWASNNCLFSWGTVGCSPESDGSFINSVDVDPTHRLVVTAQDDGKLGLWNHPVPGKGHKHLEFRGHSSHVTSVRFTRDGSKVLSTGGHDLALMQWKVDEARKAEDEGKTYTVESD